MSQDIYQVIFRVSEALELPVVILALLALAYLVVQLGGFAVEWVARSRRDFTALRAATDQARELIQTDDPAAAASALTSQARSRTMAATLTAIVTDAGTAGTADTAETQRAEARIAKHLADFDFDCQARLNRTRLLVRFGPALGLMGTLIPLSPALEGLAAGDTQTLADNLRIAFSVTVLGIGIGVVAFAISLVRERLYGQDYSDLEYVAAILTSSPDPTRPAQESR